MPRLGLIHVRYYTSLAIGSVWKSVELIQIYVIQQDTGRASGSTQPTGLGMITVSTDSGYFLFWISGL